MKASLRIPPSEVRAYCERYDYEADPKLAHVREAAKQQRYITRSQLHEIARWKSKRRAKLVEKNDEGFVREVTEFAFRAAHEHSRIGALVLLSGVQYPTASVVLHFCADDTYPILDFRAIWSLGLNQPSVYTPEYWVEYIGICRSLAKEHGLSVREFDMALWQYSRENQENA
jgi:thermostable 8-oxoguanine DNA glycosylase